MTKGALGTGPDVALCKGRLHRGGDIYVRALEGKWHFANSKGETSGKHLVPPPEAVTHTCQGRDGQESAEGGAEVTGSRQPVSRPAKQDGVRGLQQGGLGRWPC